MIDRTNLRLHLQSRRRLLALSFLSALAACGGGGSSNPSPPPPPPPPPLAAPAAGALGAVLAANAADLRPTIDGAKWNYHVRHYGAGGAYDDSDSSISQAAAADGSGSFAEHSFNVFGSDGDVAVKVANGQVTDVFATAAGTSGTGNDGPASIVELRSPVQVNDQYVQWHAAGIDVGDIDGDGVSDQAEYLVYSTIVGSEQVTLPELGRTVAAVRVDTTTLIRVTQSTNGATLPVQNDVQSTWYAPGIGIVRESQTAASNSGTGALAYDEVLFSWDGVTTGLGAVGPTATELPPVTSADYAPPPIAATVIGNEALVLGGGFPLSSATLLTAAVMSSDGRVLRGATLPNLGAFTSPYSTPVVYGTGGNTALLVGMGDSQGQLQINLQAIDDTPALVGPTHTISLPTTSSIAPTAWDGRELWVAWTQDIEPFGSEVMLQPFDTNGNALAPARVLDSVTSGTMGNVQLSGAGGALMATWVAQTFDHTAYRYATIASRDAAPRVFLLADVGEAYSLGSVNFAQLPTPVLGTDTAAIVWRGPVFSFSGFGPPGDTTPRGVILDANGAVVRSTGGSLDAETLPMGWASASGAPLLVAARGGRLFFANYAMSQQVDWTKSTIDLLQGHWLTPGTTALATAAAGASLQGVGPSDLPSGLQSETPTLVLLWPDRALVVGETLPYAETTSFWLN